MIKFKEMQISSGRFREKNDCVVKAIAIAAGITYEESHALLKKHGRKDRKGTFRYTTSAALRELKPEFTYERPTRESGSLYTPRTIGKEYPTGNYILFFRGHAAAMVDGVVEDWTSDTCKRIFQIVKL